MSTVTEVAAPRPTNASVGERLGVSHAHVSRLRYGQRLPSLDLMRIIADKTGWSLESQDLARRKETYAAEFRRCFDLADDRESEDGAPVPDQR